MTSPRPRTFLLAGWVVFLLYAYPGYLLTENADQIMDARIGAYLDWHAPMFSALWRLVGHVIAGPAGMLLIQSGLLLLGVFWTLRRCTSERTAAIAAACVLLFPPILGTAALVCPEALLASLLLVAIELLRGERPATTIGGLALLALACGLVAGTSLAILPIVVWTLRWRDLAGVRRIGLALGAWLVVVVTSAGIVRLIEVRTGRDAVDLAMVDVIGTLRFAPSLDDTRVRSLLGDAPLIDAPQLQQRARNVYGKQLFYAATEQRVFEPAETEAQRDAVIAARSSIIRAYPGAYLAHRWHALSRFARTPASLYTGFVENIRDAEAMSHLARNSAVQIALIRVATSFDGTVLLRPFVYFALALVLLPLALVRRHHDAALLLASALGHVVALLLFSTRLQYQDAHWAIVATVVAIIIAVARSASARRRSAPPTGTRTTA